MLKRESFLAQVRVLELSDDVGAAFCGQLLATMGADVVRFLDAGQRPATNAESMAVTTDHSAAEISFERFSQRIVLDGDAATKRNLLAEYAQDADVVITDYSPSRLKTLGMHWDDARFAYPNLVFARVSVFGSVGPKADWLGGDLESQAMSGVIGQLGASDGVPICMPYKTGLMHGGLHTAGAVAAALYQRRRTGEGAFIDMAAGQNLAADVRNYSLMMRYYDLPLKRSGRRPQGSLGRYPTAIFPCKDGYVVLTARSGEQYRNMLAMMGNPAWAKEPQFQDPLALAMELADEADKHVIPWLMQYTREELVEKGREFRFPVGPLLTLDEVLDDAQFKFRSFYGSVDIGGKSYVLPGNPALITYGNV